MTLPYTGSGTTYRFDELRVGEVFVTGEADIAYEADDYGNEDWMIYDVRIESAIALLSTRCTTRIGMTLLKQSLRKWPSDERYNESRRSSPDDPQHCGANRTASEMASPDS